MIGHPYKFHRDNTNADEAAPETPEVLVDATLPFCFFIFTMMCAAFLVGKI